MSKKKAPTKAATTKAPATPRPRPKAKKTQAKPKGPPSRAAVVKTILDDLTSPLVPADAAELFAASVMEQLKDLAPDLIARFDRTWFNVFVDLATAVVNRCPEEDVAATLKQLREEEDNGLYSRVLRRRFARSLPAEAVAQLDDVGRYWLSVAAIAAAQMLLADEELWDAMWGRKAGWYPVVMIAKEAPAAEPDDDTT